MEHTLDELLTVCVARQVRDGDLLAQGLSTPLIAAGYLLALRTHAPNLLFASAIGQSICRTGAPLGLAGVEGLWLDLALMRTGFVEAVVDWMPRLRPKEWFRPGQVDAQGNFNNVAFGRSHDRPRLRLPGTGGIPDVTCFLTATYLYVPRHTRSVFAERIDFCSGLGHVPDRRKGAGPCYLVTDLGQFDFFGGRMRLTHAHPGQTTQSIQAKTGFELAVASPLWETEAPTDEELRLLRTEVDPLGVRRLEFLSGPERKRLLTSLLRLELERARPA
jgi:acyl CoA:acetate/3-ketoacid CoA transferase beta subunit